MTTSDRIALWIIAVMLISIALCGWDAVNKMEIQNTIIYCSQMNAEAERADDCIRRALSDDT